MIRRKLSLRGYKRGAASFYIVAFSTLILVIIAASFATVIISEVTRASNDDLSQSAYDSALAGIEDAKLAYANYRRCVEKNPGYLTSVPSSLDDDLSCNNIVYFMTHPDEVGCDMVALMLGRISKQDWEAGRAKEVMISETTETSGDNTTNMNQAYTCVMINTDLENYRANLTSDNNVRVVRAEFENARADDINYIRLSWYTLSGEYSRTATEARRGEATNFKDFDKDKGRVTFRPVGEIRPSVPPTIELQMIQTDQTFTLSQLNGASSSNGTDRATLFLVPTNNDTKAGTSVAYDSTSGNGYNGTWNGSTNLISKVQVTKTNDQSISNLPFVVYCDPNGTSDFLCSATIELPKPSAGGNRSDDTFMFLVTLPYGAPDTDFSIEFLRSLDGSPVNIKGTQVLIDSTGRANDLYRRVEVRLETTDTSFPYTYYAVQLFGNEQDTLKKDMVVTCENNFYDRNTRNNNLQTNLGSPEMSNC